MKKLTYYSYIIFCAQFICLDLVQSQIQQLPVTSLPTVTPTSSAPVQAPAQAVTPTITPVTTAPPVPILTVTEGKFLEYQSYCRQNDFDEKLLLTTVQKKRRLDLLEMKLKSKPINDAVINALIKEYLTQKELALARVTYNKYINQLKTEDALIWAAEFDFQNRQPTAAVLKLEKFIAENPSSVKSLLKLAQIKKNLLFYSEAVDIFLDLQKLNKKNDYSADLCELYVLDSQHKDAEKICALAILKNSSSPLPEIFLGISYREREMYKEAQLNFESSLKKMRTEFALTCLGELYYLKKDRKKTIEYLNQAVAQNKLSYRAQMGLAIAEFEEKKYKQALVSFTEACRLGQKDTLNMRKSYQILDAQKSPFAKNYFDEIQKCKTQNLF